LNASASPSPSGLLLSVCTRAG